MLAENCLENPVNLKKIKNEKILEKYSLVLKDDIWKRGLLLLRRGLYLSEEVIDKLINFGIYEINVHYYEDNCKEEEKYIERLKRNFLKDQNVFIFDKNIKTPIYLANILIHTGYKRSNIFALSNSKLATKYFRNKKPDYLVIDYESNLENITDIVKEAYSHTHIFLIVNDDTRKSDSFIKLRNDLKFFKINLISKPLSLGYFLRLISDCIDLDFSELLNNEYDEFNPAAKRIK